MDPKKPRQTRIRVKTAKGRRLSSTLWLERQLNDPFVQAAKKEGYRSRAAYKLVELDKKFSLFKAGMNVIDLGAAPGGWTQVALQRIINTKHQGKVIAIDLQEFPPIEGAIALKRDFLEEGAEEEIIAIANGKVQVVMSDMAAASTGHSATDHMRIMMLCEAAYYFACRVLALNGSFVAKILRGGTEQQLLQEIKKSFTQVKHYKPEASRSDSSEMYIVALGYKGT